MKWVNPLSQPLAVAGGALVLLGGVLVLAQPLWVMALASMLVAFGISNLMVEFKKPPPALPPTPINFTPEQQALLEHARDLARRSSRLEKEAEVLLANTEQLELFGAIRVACALAQELPTHIETALLQMGDGTSLLAEEPLLAKLREVDGRIVNSSGVAREQWLRLQTRLRENLELAREGKSAQEAQTAQLTGMIVEAEGVLQSLQNRIRSANLADANESLELRNLCDELSGVQETLSAMVSR